MDSGRIRAAMLAGVMVLTAACGGGDAPAASPESSGGGTGQVARNSDELLPELAGFPVPDGASLLRGVVSAGFASQAVATDLSVEETMRFYLDRLPSAGFTITDEGAQTADDIRPGQPNIIGIEDAEGHPGNLVVQSGEGTATQVSVSLNLN